jgi:hypothetical protein
VLRVQSYDFLEEAESKDMQVLEKSLKKVKNKHSEKAELISTWDVFAWEPRFKCM